MTRHQPTPETRRFAAEVIRLVGQGRVTDAEQARLIHLAEQARASQHAANRGGAR